MEQDTEVLELDLDQLKYLTDEDKLRYKRLETLFASDGFPLLVALCTRLAIESHNRAANASNWEQNRMNIGLRMAYEHIANIELSTHREFIEIADSNRQKALEANLEDEIEHQS